MINANSLKSPKYLARIKAAIVAAVRKSHTQVCPTAVVYALDRKGEPSLAVIARRGTASHGPHELEFIDRHDNDVSAVVLAALQAWHAGARLAVEPLPLITVEYDSGPIEGLPLYIKPVLAIVGGSKAA